MRNLYGSWKKERFRNFERRKRRLQRIPWPVRVSALRRDWYGEKRVTREEWIVLHLGWLPEEREQMIQFLESKGGYSRCQLRSLSSMWKPPRRSKEQAEGSRPS
jgi:hypothetical protein